METPTPTGLAVSGLMQQLKSGEISKMQLFQQLAKLQVVSTGSPSAVPPPAPVTSSASLINADCNILPAGLEILTSSSAISFTDTGSDNTTARVGLASYTNSSIPAQYSFGAAVMPMPLSGRTMSVSSESSRELFFAATSESSHFNPAKHNYEEGEQLYHEQSCVEFEGNSLNAYPTKGKKNFSCGSTNFNMDGKFHARVTHWKSQKEADRKLMKEQLMQAELKNCTFSPKINPKSTKFIANLRERQPAIVSNQNLSTLQAVSERLYQEADIYRIREELAAKWKADKEAEIERECTFKPKINASDAVKAKYMSIKSTISTAASREAAAKEIAECTFCPKVNNIKSEMVSAQHYLQQNIYERLSQPYCGDAEPSANPRRRSLSFDGNQDGYHKETWSSQDDISVHPGGLNRPRSSSETRRGEGPRSLNAGQSSEENEKRARQFKSFMKRQQFHAQARHKRIELNKQQLTPGYKPAINRKSLALMENGRKGDFIERIAMYALRKDYEFVKNKNVRSTDPNCTFKPEINQISTKRKPRSITELSRGDLLRRETTQQLMKLKVEQEEMIALTFRPQLNRVSDRYEGRLKILSNPDTYLQRIQQKSEAQIFKQRQALQEREIDEFAECTFKPRTIQAPPYVKRIAKSVSLKKAFRAQQQAAARAREKPDWK